MNGPKPQSGRQRAVGNQPLIPSSPYPFVRLFIFLALAITQASVAPARAAELPTVEVGLPGDGLFGLGGHYVLDKGLDRKNGFIMKPRWSDVAAIERLLAIGAIPVGLSTAESALRANIKGIPIHLVQPFMRGPHNYLLVRKESPYKSVMDLKGRSLAITPEVTSLYNLFDYAMRKQAVNIEREFQLKKLGAAAIIALLEKGEVEGAWLWEAHVSRMLATGKYREIMTLSDEINRLLNVQIHMFGWLGALDSWAQQNPQLVSKLRTAWHEMIGGVQNDEAHFRKHAKSLFALEGSEVVALGWNRTRIFLLPPDFPWPDKQHLENQKKYLKEAAELGIFPKEAKDHIDRMFVP